MAIATGAAHACAIDAAGRARCWGGNGRGQLGDGTTETRLAPVPVEGAGGFVAISAGTSHTCALGSDGSVWCWGENVAGQLGNGQPGPGPHIGSSVPVRAQVPVPLVQIEAGTGHTCGLAAAGAVYCWGWNVDGQIGDDELGDRATPARVQTPERFVRIAAGSASACGIRSDGRAFCWGRNEDGELGDGAGIHHTFPWPVSDP
jgi:alpha-tubulin suppressor-like RCC1 family protein